MEFVENQEVQALCCGDEVATLVRACQHQVEHDVVGQENVRRIRKDLPTVVLALLARVASESDRLVTVAVSVLEELLQLEHLAVCQGVHRIHDDRLHAPPRVLLALTQDPVDDRHDVGQGLARAGPSCQHVRVPGRRRSYGVSLVPVEGEPHATGIVPVLLHTEDLFALRM